MSRPDHRLMIERAHISIMRSAHWCWLTSVIMLGKWSTMPSQKIDINVRGRQVTLDMTPISTAATDGFNVYYNEDFLDKAWDAGKDKAIRAVVLHENLHKAYRHMSVWKHLWDKDAARTNIACVDAQSSVRMADGTCKRADYVVVGDRIATPFGADTVIATQHSDKSDMVEIDITEYGTLVCTADHRILTRTGYVEAQYINETTELAVDAARGQYPPYELRYGTGARNCDPTWTGRKQYLRAVTKVKNVWNAVSGAAEQNACTASVDRNRLGVLRGFSRRRRDYNVLGTQNEVRHGELTGGDFCIQHFDSAGRVVKAIGYDCDTAEEPTRHPVLEVLYHWLGMRRNSTPYAAVCKNTGAPVRHTNGVVCSEEGAAVLRPTDSAHHVACGGIEGVKFVRGATCRRFTSHRRVVDITCSKQCFIAENFVVHNCDIVIDHDISETPEFCYGFKELSELMGMNFAHMREWAGKNTAEVFALLDDNTMQQMAQRGGKGEGGKGEGGKGEGGMAGDVHIPDTGQGDKNGDGTPVEGNGSGGELSEEVQNALMDAAVRSGLIVQRGRDPGRAARNAAALAPKVDWRAELRNWLQGRSFGYDKNNWRRPSRRSASVGVYLPSHYSERVGGLLIAIDTSGSINETLLGQFLGELGALCSTLQPKSVDLVYWDGAIAAEERYLPQQYSTLVQSTKPAGGGGTTLRCVLDHARKLTDLRGIVVFTDGYVESFFPGQWPAPVFTVLNSTVACPLPHTRI